MLTKKLLVKIEKVSDESKSITLIIKMYDLMKNARNVFQLVLQVFQRFKHKIVVDN